MDRRRQRQRCRPPGAGPEAGCAKVRGLERQPPGRAAGFAGPGGLNAPPPAAYSSRNITTASTNPPPGCSNAPAPSGRFFQRFEQRVELTILALDPAGQLLDDALGFTAIAAPVLFDTHGGPLVGIGRIGL